MNTNKKSIIRNTICSIIAILTFVFANIYMLNISKSSIATYAADNSNEITISNANFTKDTSTTYPIKSVSGFTAYSNNVAASNTNPNCGVIDLSDDDYATRFAIAQENRVGIDDKVLMLTSDSSSVNYGYRTSSAISMNKNSNYVITVDVFTETNAGIANISLYKDSEVLTEINNINSANTWTTYHLFVKTGEESCSLNLGLNLVAAGTVLFDNIHCEEINDLQLADKILTQEDADIDYAYKNTTDENSKVVSFTVVDNKFFDGTNNIELNATNFNPNKNDEEYTEISTVYDNDGTVNKALKINNKQKTYIEYSTEDNFLNFEQGLTYKVSVVAKAKNIKGSAGLKLVQTNLEEGKTGIDSELISISSNTTSSLKNGYNTYSFFVKGSPKADTTYKLVTNLGNAETEASGEFYISQVNVTKIKTSNVPSSSATEKIINLSESYALSGNSLYVNNGKFDAFSITDLQHPFPAKATDWTETLGTGTQAYGVVNTKLANFNALENKLNYPFAVETNENLLMMYNQNEDTLSYKSSSKNLAANTYHKFTVKVQSQNANLKVALVASKDGAEFELGNTSIYTTSQVWETLTFYVKTGKQAIDVSLKATLTSNNQACAFIDDATFDYPSATETGFNNASNSDTTVKIDLTNLTSNNFFTAEENTNSSFEVVDFNTALNQVGEENVENFNKYVGTNSNLVKLTNMSDTDFSATSNLGYTLTSNSKYKFTVDVFSVGLRTEVEEADLDKLGFGIKLTGFDNAFTAKQTNGSWKTYTFYIQPNSDVTSYIEFSLGNADLASSGTVYFGNINFEELAEDFDFEDVDKLENTVVLNTVTTPKDEDPNEDNNDKTNSTFDKQTLLYLIPSIVFALAIVITIVGVLVRKIKWKKPTHKTKNSYDRNKTVSKQYYERKATMLREEKLRELNKQLNTLHEDRIKFEEEYKHNLSKLREMKIKRASKIEIAKLEKEMKKNQRTSSSFGVSVSKLEREIEYVQTDLYYNSLVKKLASQGTTEETEEK